MTLDNLNNPSEYIEYDPRLLVLFGDILGGRKQYYFECGVVDAPECD